MTDMAVVEDTTIPSFWEIVAEVQGRNVFAPPPLQLGEHQEDRDFVDALLQRHWDDDRPYQLTPSEHGQKEFIYGEVTPNGVRQLLQEMELMEYECDDVNDNIVDNNDPDVVFYDLGSGAGKLVVQVLLETKRVQQVVGVELSPSRHALALKSWQSLQEDLLREANNSDGNESSEGESDITFILPLQQLTTKLQERLHAQSSSPAIQFHCRDLLEINWGPTATHIYASSTFFPDSVLERLQEQLMQHARAYQTLRLVAALSDLTLLEETSTAVTWSKRVTRIQMSWGAANVCIYTPDYSQLTKPINTPTPTIQI